MEKRINSISLFSGIGAIEYAATEFVFGPNYRTIQFVEIEPTAQKILQSQFPGIPIHGDIRTYHPPIMRSPNGGGGELNSESGGGIKSASVIVGGFPCTNTSSAGKREGLAGEESGLWWSMYRIILEASPDFVIIENPEGVIHRGLRTILGALRMAGYQTEVEMFSAQEFGAPHRRLRLFILAHADRLILKQRQGWSCWSEQVGTDSALAKQTFADSIHSHSQRFRIPFPTTISNSQSKSGLGSTSESISETESGGLPLADGFPDWVAGLHLSGWWATNPPPTDVGVEPRTPGRRDAIKLYGKSICIPQAIAVLLRLQSLLQLL
jgi:DNA (cytosine-5)-methyltransferase 1